MLCLMGMADCFDKEGSAPRPNTLHGHSLSKQKDLLVRNEILIPLSLSFSPWGCTERGLVNIHALKSAWVGGLYQGCYTPAHRVAHHIASCRQMVQKWTSSRQSVTKQCCSHINTRFAGWVAKMRTHLAKLCLLSGVTPLLVLNKTWMQLKSMGHKHAGKVNSCLHALYIKRCKCDVYDV